MRHLRYSLRQGRRRWPLVAFQMNRRDANKAASPLGHYASPEQVEDGWRWRWAEYSGRPGNAGALFQQPAMITSLDCPGHWPDFIAVCGASWSWRARTQSFFSLPWKS